MRARPSRRLTNRKRTARGRLVVRPRATGPNRSRPSAVRQMHRPTKTSAPRKHPTRFPTQSTEFYSAKYNVVLYHATKCAMTAMRRYLDCKRVLIGTIPPKAKILYVVRDPVSRFVSGFLTLRNIGLRPMYRVRPLSAGFVANFKRGDLLVIFLRALVEIEARGPFDTHFQPQQAFLGPSATVQNEFAGGRSPAKIDWMVKLPDLDRFCACTFGAAPQHANFSSKGQAARIHKHINAHSSVRERIERIYAADLALYQSDRTWQPTNVVP